MATKEHPIAFIHGLWLHATSWGDWQELFTAAGYDTSAPGWPGEQWVVPSPGRPLFEASVANVSPHSPLTVDTDNSDRGPLLLVMGGLDHTVPEAITKSTLKQYRHSDAVTDLLEFPDRGHSLTIDSGWKEVAEGSRQWLEQQGL